jgi:hypothetical protein
MFVEVVQGMATDPLKIHQLLDRWVIDVAPQAPGWHDTTAGVAADGRFIAMIRFDSTVAPIPGHDQWRAETMDLLNGDTSHAVYDRVVVLKEGAVGTVGFVQFVLGRVHDLAAAETYLKDFDEIIAPRRPDSTGRLMASRDDGQFIGAFAFGSELAARSGEAQEVSPRIAEMKRRGAALGDGRAEYIDLTDPWVYLPVHAPQAARERPVDPLNVRLLSSLENATVLDAVIRAVEPVAGRLVAREPVRRILHGDSTGVPVHLIVRDLPSGAWFMAQFLDLFSDPGSTRAARRLVGFGVLTAVPTAVTGWAEWALADRNIRRVGIMHAAVQGGAVLIFLGSWVARVHDRRALGVHLARMGGIGLAVGGFLGGHMAGGRRVGTTAPTPSIDPPGLGNRS